MPEKLLPALVSNANASLSESFAERYCADAEVINPNNTRAMMNKPFIICGLCLLEKRKIRKKVTGSVVNKLSWKGYFPVFDIFAEVHLSSFSIY